MKYCGQKNGKGASVFFPFCAVNGFGQHNRLGHVLIVYSRNTKFANFIKVTRDTEFNLHTSKQISVDKTWS